MQVLSRQADAAGDRSDARQPVRRGFVGRYEELSDARILDRLGIEQARRPELPKLNEGRRRPYRDYYTGEARSLVAQRFRYEIDRFDYTF